MKGHFTNETPFKDERISVFSPNLARTDKLADQHIREAPNGYTHYNKICN